MTWSTTTSTLRVLLIDGQVRLRLAGQPVLGAEPLLRQRQPTRVKRLDLPCLTVIGKEYRLIDDGPCDGGEVLAHRSRSGVQRYVSQCGCTPVIAGSPPRHDAGQ